MTPKGVTRRIACGDGEGAASSLRFLFRRAGAGLCDAPLVRGLGLGDAGFLRGADLDDTDARVRAAGHAAAPADLSGGMAGLSIVGSSRTL